LGPDQSPGTIGPDAGPSDQSSGPGTKEIRQVQGPRSKGPGPGTIGPGTGPTGPGPGTKGPAGPRARDYWTRPRAVPLDYGPPWDPICPMAPNWPPWGGPMGPKRDS